MPDISKINALAIGSVGKVDGLAKASILDIDGVAVPSAFLLDTYTGAAAAYSVRKLKTGVTVAARIRRSGDDIEADVEFDSNNEISLTSPISNASSGTYTDLADFVDHTTTPRDAFCVEWKDQSGNGYHATQPTAGGSGQQPKLYDATTGLITENGKPVIDPDSTDFLQTSLAGGGTTWAFSVGKVDQQYQMFLSNTGNIPYVGYARDTQTLDSWASITTPDHYLDGSAITAPNRDTLHAEMATQRLLTITIFQSGGISSGFYLGFSSSIPMYNMQELIIYNSDQSSNRSGIEDNINGFFSIYP